jgi:hypothetical protein
MSRHASYGRYCAETIADLRDQANEFRQQAVAAHVLGDAKRYAVLCRYGDDARERNRRT